MFIRSVLGLFAATLILTGCGDSDGSSTPSYTGPTSPVGITTTAEGNTTVGASTTQAFSNGMSSISGIYAPFTATDPAAATLPALSVLAKKYADIAFKLDVKTFTKQTPSATASQNYTCAVSGSFTASATTPSPSTYPQAGDTLNFTFNNCIETSGVMISGSLGLVINTYVSGSDFSGTYTYSRLKTTLTSSGDYGMIHGSYTASITDTISLFTASLTGTSMYFESSVGGVLTQEQISNFSYVDTLDHSTFEVTVDHDFTFASTEIGGSVTVSTVTPFAIASGDSYPYVGQLIVTAASNAKVRLTAEDNVNVTIEYDLDGNDIYETTLTGIAWTSL